MKLQIPNHKHQITNKFQVPNSKRQTLSFEILYLFGICDLVTGAYSFG